MQTLDSYSEQEERKRGWKDLVGSFLSFAGFFLLTRAFLIFVPFGRLLPLWLELTFSLAGGIIGVIGMRLLGYTSDDISGPVSILLGGIIASLFTSFVSSKFGIVGLVVLMGAF